MTEHKLPEGAATDAEIQIGWAGLTVPPDEWEDRLIARIRHDGKRIAELELTGNPNAVNCDAHGHPIAYIPANGPCPACELVRTQLKAVVVCDDMEERVLRESLEQAEQTLANVAADLITRGTERDEAREDKAALWGVLNLVAEAMKDTGQFCAQESDSPGAIVFSMTADERARVFDVVDESQPGRTEIAKLRAALAHWPRMMLRLEALLDGAKSGGTEPEEIQQAAEKIYWLRAASEKAELDVKWLAWLAINREGPVYQVWEEQGEESGMAHLFDLAGGLEIAQQVEQRFSQHPRDAYCDIIREARGTDDD